MEEADNQPKNIDKEPFFVKTLWIIFTPLFGLLGYSTIYLVGVTYHQAWVNHFGIDSSFFEKSTTDYLIYAYVALITICSNWLSVLTDTWIALSTLGVAALFTIEIAALAWLPRTRLFQSAGSTINKRKFLSIPLAIFAMAGGTTLTLLLLPLVANLLLITPGLTGYKAAQMTIDRNAPIYALGCEKADRRQDYCVRLLDSQIEIARGFVIDSSNERIALYLDGKATILPLKDYRIETIIPSPQMPDVKTAQP
ncbi:hypothetical protein NA643_19065 [Pseudomonas stutzeri]|uniref:hypothetical protein n=1 Tax=Stutzerimonas stutzeri TaxID=316 RepID=UPI000C9B3C62|nr:hypothetical protein [Stutzerimonas stutzeri]MCQ4281183.1 hypothetical protein [Stutzerimonas stutzeri]PNF70977.1 hypothetical protein CXK96_20235 [Stutzerimonas stutzeri]